MAYKQTREAEEVAPGVFVEEYETIIPWVIKDALTDRLANLIYSGQLDTDGTTAESGDNFRVTWESDPDGYAEGSLFYEVADRLGYYSINLVHGNLSLIQDGEELTFTQIIEE